MKYTDCVLIAFIDATQLILCSSLNVIHSLNTDDDANQNFLSYQGTKRYCLMVFWVCSEMLSSISKIYFMPERLKKIQEKLNN